LVAFALLNAKAHAQSFENQFVNFPAGQSGEKIPLLDIDCLSLGARLGTLVDEISLTVHEGEMVGLLGESGCGKTITALSILGLLPEHAVRVTGGSIRFRSRDITGLDDTQMNAVRGRHIGMIFQEPMTSLNPIMTIGDQIGEVLEMHKNLRGRKRRDEVLKLLGLVGLPQSRDQLAKYPFQLSGGQRQRVMIAIALACEPALLIADEPTTALDVTIQAQILELIARMRAHFGMACILVTHDLGVVAESCDRAIVMYAGRIVEQGPVDVLFSRPIHRYTQALLETIPSANRRGEQLPAIAGTVPQPGERPAGCTFAGRCNAATEKCRDQRPPVVQRGDHLAYCWNPAS
jgi:peptide/nickel transport system ATP-binding protein